MRIIDNTLPTPSVWKMLFECTKIANFDRNDEFDIFLFIARNKSLLPFPNLVYIISTVILIIPFLQVRHFLRLVDYYLVQYLVV